MVTTDRITSGPHRAIISKFSELVFTQPGTESFGMQQEVSQGNVWPNALYFEPIAKFLDHNLYRKPIIDDYILAGDIFSLL